MSIWNKWRQEYRRWMSPQQMMEAARNHQTPHERMQAPKRQTAFCYSEGPMKYLGQQMVKRMQDAGYPAKILFCYRSPDIQRELYAKGRTKPGRIVTRAKPWQSAHQYYEAVDIIHPSKGWNVSEEYWDTLNAIVGIVSLEYGVKLSHGHDWKFRDSAHIELSDWRHAKKRHQRKVLAEGEARPPTPLELWERFQEVLPKVAKSYVSRRLLEPPSPANDRAMKRAVARLDR